MHNELLDRAGGKVAGAAGVVTGAVTDVVTDVVDAASHAAAEISHGGRSRLARCGWGTDRGHGRRTMAGVLVLVAGIVLAVVIGSRLLRSAADPGDTLAEHLAPEAPEPAPAP